MNLDRVEQIAKATLYEGYMLYPYRPSSVKNRQRWNFGVLYPQSYSEAQDGCDACAMQTECLVAGKTAAKLDVRLRFLQVQVRERPQPDNSPRGPTDFWQEAVEREVCVPTFSLDAATLGPVTSRFDFLACAPGQSALNSEKEVVRRQARICGDVEIMARRVGAGVFQLTTQVRNTTPFDSSAANREDALLHSLISAHFVFVVQDGEFVSLLEPPPELQELAAQCKNGGAWPVLVGDPGQRDTLLASPIILYDYPQIAPESAGDLFDGTEIDEILSLRILTLTDEEKREIRESDERARQVLERTETMPPEQFMKLHGAVRGLRPVRENIP